MKLFLSRIRIFIGVQIFLFTFIGIIFFFYPEEDRYYATTVDKLHRLHSSPSPRLILIGGSNLTLGLDSVVLDKAFDYSIVNMGLHAGVDH